MYSLYTNIRALENEFFSEVTDTMVKQPEVRAELRHKIEQFKRMLMIVAAYVTSSLIIYVVLTASLFEASVSLHKKFLLMYNIGVEMLELVVTITFAFILRARGPFKSVDDMLQQQDKDTVEALTIGIHETEVQMDEQQQEKK